MSRTCPQRADSAAIVKSCCEAAVCPVATISSQLTALPNVSESVLIGAYANGNIGDMYQADAIAGELLSIDPTLEVFSTSPSKRSSNFPSERHKRLPQSAVRDADMLNSFDLILVGGGGLLAARHAPLPEVEWVRSIRTTLCGLAIGCAGEAPEQSRAFIEKCARFSVRDEYSAKMPSHRSGRTSTSYLDPIFLGRLGSLKGEAPASGKERNSVGTRETGSGQH